MSCCRTAVSSSWSRKRGAPGTPARRPGPERPISIRARSASRSPIPGTTTAIPPFPNGRSPRSRRSVAASSGAIRIPADRVLAHSDVAPARKQDPGEKFPWKALADSGIGLWVKPAPIEPGGAIFALGETSPIIQEMQELLAKYGYEVAATGYLDAPRSTPSPPSSAISVRHESTASSTPRAWRR